jgi:predicted O-linked N-acetylglucosamine transferase (SPINDLY family)
MRACAWSDLQETTTSLRDITYKTIARGEPSPMRSFMAVTYCDGPMLAVAVGHAEAARLPERKLPAPEPERPAVKKLTIGYLSAGCGNHPTGQLVATCLVITIESVRRSWRLISGAMTARTCAGRFEKTARACSTSRS